METQQHHHDQPYAPSFERYNSYAKVGWFLQFTARENGKLVGYSGVYVTPSMHTQATISVEDTWYLLPEYRKGWNAIKFYKFIEAYGKPLGVHEAVLTIPATKDPRLGHMLERMGYTAVAVKYSKNLVRADSPSHQQAVEESPHVRTGTARPT
jgi:GNAT superfamily N-acetyltransferase